MSETHLHRWGPSSAPKLIAVHGFADEGAAFARLGDSATTQRFELIAPSLPGFAGARLPAGFTPTVAGYAAFVLELADQVSPDAPVGLIAHSVGSVISVAAARQKPDRITALMSIEGNLTATDAYFSGQAAHFETPDAFKPHFEAHIEGLAQTDAGYSRYLAAVRQADAAAMWSLGRDAARLGDSVGEAFVRLERLGVETMYCWGRRNTTARTKAFLDAHPLLNTVENADVGHWIFEDAPEWIAALALEFFTQDEG